MPDPTRTTALDFTDETKKIAYNSTGGAAKEASPEGDITDSGEGWAWYATGSAIYVPGDEITHDNHPAKTLILDGLRLGASPENAPVLTLPADTTVVVKGNNIVENTDPETGGGILIDAETGDATFTGPGTLTVSGAEYGIKAGCGLVFAGSGTVNARSGGGSEIPAIYANLGYKQTGGTVTAASVGGYGLCVADGSINIEGGTLTASGLDGIYCGEGHDISISGGTVTATGSEHAISGDIETSGAVKAGESVGSATILAPDSPYDLTEMAYVRIFFTPEAQVNDVTISGTVGLTIAPQDVTIRLINDRFSEIAVNTVVSTWLRNNNGLVATVSSLDENYQVITIKINGIPNAPVNDALKFLIPANVLESNADLYVTENPSAKMAIAGSGRSDTESVPVMIAASSFPSAPSRPPAA